MFVTMLFVHAVLAALIVGSVAKCEFDSSCSACIAQADCGFCEVGGCFQRVINSTESNGALITTRCFNDALPVSQCVNISTTIVTTIAATTTVATTASTVPDGKLPEEPSGLGVDSVIGLLLAFLLTCCFGLIVAGAVYKIRKATMLGGDEEIFPNLVELHQQEQEEKRARAVNKMNAALESENESSVVGEAIISELDQSSPDASIVSVAAERADDRKSPETLMGGTASAEVRSRKRNDDDRPAWEPVNDAEARHSISSKKSPFARTSIRRPKKTGSSRKDGRTASKNKQIGARENSEMMESARFEADYGKIQLPPDDRLADSNNETNLDDDNDSGDNTGAAASASEASAAAVAEEPDSNQAALPDSPASFSDDSMSHGQQPLPEPPAETSDELEPEVQQLTPLQQAAEKACDTAREGCSVKVLAKAMNPVVAGAMSAAKANKSEDAEMVELRAKVKKQSVAVAKLAKKYGESPESVADEICEKLRALADWAKELEK